MQVNMKARQIREIKSYRYWQIPAQDCLHLDDFEFVFSKDNAYKINIYTGHTEWIEYAGHFTDYTKLVEGIPDDVDVLVDVSVYRTWFETKDK